MRLSRSMSAEAGLACAFALATLALATANSAAHAGSSAPVSRHLTFHHKSVDPRAIAQVPATPALFSPDYFGSYIPSPRKARDRWTEPESRRLREVWLYRQWRLTHVAMRRAARHCQRSKAIQGIDGCNQWIALQASGDASSRSEPAVIMSDRSGSQKAGARSLAF
jgi:hypothetical protein